MFLYNLLYLPPIYKWKELIHIKLLTKTTNNMKKEMFYESPMTVVFGIQSEGALCGSTFESLDYDNASFENYDEVNW